MPGALAQIRRDLDIGPDQLRVWAHERAESCSQAPRVAGETLEQENRRLRRELATLWMEQAIPRKSGGVHRERVAMRCAVFARHVEELSVRLMCRVLDVSPTGFYTSSGAPRRAVPWRAVIDDVLIAHVKIAFRDSGGTNCAPRIQSELRAEALATSTKRVTRSMRQAGLITRSQPRHDAPVAPNRLGGLLARDSCRNLRPELALDFAPVRRSPWRTHRLPPGQLLHPSSGSPHKHLSVEGVATTD